MKKIADYIIQEKIAETYKSVIYRCLKAGDTQTSIVKVLKNANPSPTDIARFKYENKIIRKINIDGILKAYDVITYNSLLAIVLEDFGAISLKQIISNGQFTVTAFLKTAIEIAKILGEIHKKDIIHNDIKPANILINQKEEIIKLADFGISRVLTKDDDKIYEPSVIEGSLVYMSPEQTGRMNRSIDYRSDLYSLGITFYEMLTGTIPFKSTDPMEIIHSHMAKVPIAPHIINKDIPGIISRIIMKLLSKTAEDRYQSSHGLVSDLERCLNESKTAADIKIFNLGSQDIPTKFYMPQVLVGRGKEIKKIFDSFSKISDGTRECICVSGLPGIGKSSMIKEINRPIVAANGYFLSGKFNKFGQDVPYSAIIDAFQNFIQQLLMESKEKIHFWKIELKAALGNNGKIITDIIPDVELIIGKQFEVPLLSSEESEVRFHIVFKNFIKVFAAVEHPLIIFLDDLQWADVASINLLESILKDIELKYMLIIGAFRDNEIEKSDKLYQLFDSLSNHSIQTLKITLGPLDYENVNLLLSYFFKCHEEKTKDLATLVLKKTGGNPFFINQFLKNLHELDLLELDSKEGWTWDIESINKLKVTDNVVELMAEKITSLPQDTQEILKMSACLGSQFTLNTLSAVMDKSIEKILDQLKSAINEDFFIISKDNYIFSHDRIQEAVYSLMSDTEQAKLHFHIGNVLLKELDQDENQKILLYIVSQLNYGIKLSLSPEESKKLTLLNLQAGIRAKASNAFKSALNYLNTGIELLNNNHWNDQYHLSLSLFEEAAEAAYMSANFEKSYELTNQILKNTSDLMDSIKANEIMMNGYKLQNKISEAINTGIDILKSLGFNFPKNPKMIHVVWWLFRTKLILFKARKKDLLMIPELNDEKLQAVMRIMANVGLAAYWAKPYLVPLLAFRAIKITIEKGNSRHSPFNYAAYGFILCNLGDIDGGYRFGELAMELHDKRNIDFQKARTMQIVYNLISHWKKPLRDINKQFLKGYREALESGDIEYAVISLQVYCNNSPFIGSNLEKLDQEIYKYYQILGTLSQGTPFMLTGLYHQFVLNLIGKSDQTSSLIGKSYNELEMEDIHKKAGDNTALCSLYLFKLMLNYLFGNYEAAYKNAELAEDKLQSVAGTIMIPAYYFYFSLTILALSDDTTNQNRKKYLKTVTKYQKKMKKWAYSSPQNHLHKFYLIEAEIARINNDDEAMKYYDKAIFEANKNKYINEEAIAYELAAKYYFSKDFMRIGDLFIERAYDRFLQWGAKAKLNKLKTDYEQIQASNIYESNLATNLNKNIDTNYSDSGTISGKTLSTLDISTVIAVSQSLSREIELGQLLEVIMKLAVENAGAQMGHLLMEDPESKELKVEASASGKEISVLQSIPVADCNDLPSSIINYVYRTGKNVILDNAKKDSMFSNDPYVIRNNTKSVLCAPIIDRGNMTSILYLENNLTSSVFTSERLKLISVFMSQCAISINNTRLILKEKQNAILENEIKMARNIQQLLLPKQIPDIDNIKIAFKYEPMMEIGGDFINIKYDSKSKRLGLFICDVSGHGVSAALTASMISMSLDFYWTKYFNKPSKVIKEIRKSLIGKMGIHFFTAAICSIDLENGIFTYTSAGHPPAIILRKNADPIIIDESGRLIHEYIEPTSKDVSMDLVDGDRIILYTDGVTEAENSEREFLGAQNINKFTAWCKKISDKSSSAHQLCENIYNSVIRHTGGNNHNDDITILIAEFTKK